MLNDDAAPVTYFGGPEVNPGSSNMSSLEREEDFEFTGVSCSITCISDITECDTTLEKEEIKKKERGHEITLFNDQLIVT